jgi:superfamily II DNA or RNA helicase
VDTPVESSQVQKRHIRLKNTSLIEAQIIAAKKKLTELEETRATLIKEISRLESLRQLSTDQLVSSGGSRGGAVVTNESPEHDKIALFRTLFRGREDVFAKRFESKRSGKSGYQPVCNNEWVRPICQKPKVKCPVCENRDFTPITDDVVRNHLIGKDPTDQYQREFVIGVYPMLADETCRFLAVDFDKKSWAKDAKAYLDTCKDFSVPGALERSRSGHGGHVWIFFCDPIPAKTARQLGSFLLTQAMAARPEMGFSSYDRLFPSQDTLPKGGFGNLIALPFQRMPREKGNSVFVDENMQPFPDQWAFLSSLDRIGLEEIQAIVNSAMHEGGILGVRYVSTDEDEVEPWLLSPSGRAPDKMISGPLPDRVDLVVGNQVYINKTNLPPALRNKLIRLAAFQNPEFYRAQAMRLPTYDKPRIIHCCGDFSKYIGLPRGCLEDIVNLLESLGVATGIIDERYSGKPLAAEFTGQLRPEQQIAAEAMASHDTGVLAASTAFGKTVVAAYLVAVRAVNTLVLVHRKQLLEQWVARLNTFLDLPADAIGVIGGGRRKPTSIVDVAMIQSLSRKGVVDDIVADYGHLIVDECHHVSARSFEVVTRQCRARYVTGLSATVIRKDGHHPIIFMNCGPVRFKIDDRKHAAKRAFSHEVIVRKTQFKMKPSDLDTGYGAIHEIYAALIENEERNQMIVADVMASISQGRFPVILTERKRHLEKLRVLLEKKIENLIVMKGGMGKRQRRDCMQTLESLTDEAEKVILATGRYLGEGFDDKRLDTLFLTLPISWKGTLAQYAGRLHRDHDMKKTVRIYDYADIDVPMLSRMFERRKTGYRVIGYSITE